MDKDYITRVADKIIEASSEVDLQELKQVLQDEPEEVVQNLAVFVQANGFPVMHVFHTDEIFVANADEGDPNVHYTIAKHLANHLRDTILTKEA